MIAPIVFFLLLLFCLVLGARICDCEVGSILDLDFREFDGLSLLDLIHILVIHKIDRVRRTCSDDKDSFKNCDDQLCVKRCLQKSIHLRLLDQLFKFVKLDHLISLTSYMVPPIDDFGSYNFISDSADCNGKPKERDKKAENMINVVRASHIACIVRSLKILLVDVRRLAINNEWALEQRVDHDKFEVSLLDLALDGLGHAFLAESPKDKDHDHDSQQNIAHRNCNEQPQIHSGVIVLLDEGQFKADRCEDYRHHYRHESHPLDAGLCRRERILQHEKEV